MNTDCDAVAAVVVDGGDGAAAIVAVVADALARQTWWMKARTKTPANWTTDLNGCC